MLCNLNTAVSSIRVIKRELKKTLLITNCLLESWEDMNSLRWEMEKLCLSWLQKSWQPSDYDRPRKKGMWTACWRGGSDLEGVVKARVFIDSRITYRWFSKWCSRWHDLEMVDDKEVSVVMWSKTGCCAGDCCQCIWNGVRKCFLFHITDGKVILEVVTVVVLITILQTGSLSCFPIVRQS